MKKTLSSALLCVVLTHTVSAQKSSWLGNTAIYFGFRGGYYVTEVKIPIQQIRYQDPNTGEVKFIDYVKPVENIKLALPYIDSKVNYSLFTDPVSGIVYIRVRPLVKLVSQNGNGTVMSMNASKPFPLELTSVSPTSMATTSSVINGKMHSYTEKTEETTGTYSQQKTRTNSETDTLKIVGGKIPDTLLVRTVNRTISIPTISTTVDVDPNAPAIVKARDKDTGEYLSVGDYLFVPEGGKMPNFSQQMIHQWFFSGPLSLLIRFRPKIAARGKLPAIEGGPASTGLNLGFVTGTKHSLSTGSGKYYSNPFIYQFPLLMVGVNSTEITRQIDTDDDHIVDAYSDKESKVIFSTATGIGFQYGSVGLMLLVGKDNLFGSARKEWVYQNKLWYGFSIGVSLDKLVGLSK